MLPNQQQQTHKVSNKLVNIHFWITRGAAIERLTWKRKGHLDSANITVRLAYNLYTLFKCVWKCVEWVVISENRKMHGYLHEKNTSVVLFHCESNNTLMILSSNLLLNIKLSVTFWVAYLWRSSHSFMYLIQIISVKWY